jgi:ribosomal protein S18 acetylase RimI-like enzyme
VTTVRPAVASDMIGLLAIEDEFRETGTPTFFLFDDAWFERKILRDEILVADDDQIIGYLTWSSLWRLPWIEFARVLKARRREGVGRSMVSALEDRLRAAGGWMLVSSSTGTDKDAIAWHRAIGFKDGGRIEWKMWRGAPPEVLHYKELSPRA